MERGTYRNIGLGRMKVLIINVVCGIRSTGRICTDLAKGLEQAGHSVKIAYGRGKVPKEYQKYAVRIGSGLDVALHGCKARLADASGFGSRRATERFIAWVETYGPDIIHLHNIHGYYINVEVLFRYLKTSRKKVVWTLHDCWAFTGHSVYCDAVGCQKWKRGCGRCPQTAAYPKSLVDHSSRNWDRKRRLFTGVPGLELATPSVWLARLVGQSFLSGYRTSVIHNGVDTSQFYPLENDFRRFYSLEKKTVLLGVASSWNRQKGLLDFIRLSAMLDSRYQIVLVGVTKGQQKRLPKKVLGIGPTNSTKELAMIYSAADLFLNLTYCDNYPSVNLEALACGTPVITYHTGGSPESVPVGMGQVVEKGDLQAVLEAIKTVPAKKKAGKGVGMAKDKKDAVAEYLALYGRGGGGRAGRVFRVAAPTWPGRQKSNPRRFCPMGAKERAGRYD